MARKMSPTAKLKLARTLILVSAALIVLWFIFFILRFAIFQKSLTVAEGLSDHFAGVVSIFRDLTFFDDQFTILWKAAGWIVSFIACAVIILLIMEGVTNRKKFAFFCAGVVLLCFIPALDFIGNSGNYMYYIEKFAGKNVFYLLGLLGFLGLGLTLSATSMVASVISLQESTPSDSFTRNTVSIARLPLRPRMASRETKIQGLDIIILVILVIYTFFIVFPFWNAFIISISTEEAYLHSNLLLWPTELDLSAYKQVFADKGLWGGFSITMILLIFGTTYQLFFTVITGYALSRHNWTGKNLVMNMILVTMFFGGGMIPYYYLIRDLGMMNTIWVMIIPGAIDTFNMLLMRNYFASLPVEMEESAKIDGANDIVIFVKIFLPLSLPMLATIGLFFAVGNWNSWYNAMLFIPDKHNLWPLQMVLRTMISKVSSNIENPNAREGFSEGLTMASIFFTIVPMMCFYPFLQRFFVKGIVVGAIKG